MNPVDRLVVALDVPDLGGARALATMLSGQVGVFKVGLEQFVAHGPAAVEAARAGGAAIFLDLKIHDIPRTAAAAVRSAGTLGVRFTTLHALGGREMVAAAREAAEACGADRPQLLAVTVLTSHDAASLAALGLASDDPETNALRLARLALEAGADGLVASALEAPRLRRELGDGFWLVTPGIRLPGEAHGDQARVATPAEAVRGGASHIVVGRPIVKAGDPRAAAERVVADLAAAGPGPGGA
ncbi:MAG: orotidine-5'-phosphate decarboxylase [Acidobacteria bacterium]|jgi:orotidine-5'-phosphate decarboxylase|nr:orotidine-5'-phosphate decarboxylase [Acidobacteriota bacterium]